MFPLLLSFSTSPGRCVQALGLFFPFNKKHEKTGFSFLPDGYRGVPSLFSSSSISDKPSLFLQARRLREEDQAFSFLIRAQRARGRRLLSFLPAKPRRTPSSPPYADGRFSRCLLSLGPNHTGRGAGLLLFRWADDDVPPPPSLSRPLFSENMLDARHRRPPPSPPAERPCRVTP